MNLAKMLMMCGALLFVVGAAFYFGARLGLGNLPGDVSWRRGNVSVYAPIVSGIVISVVLTIVLNVALRFFR
jgi:hypothetical protein